MSSNVTSSTFKASASNRKHERKMKENRKIPKPLIERKRRARINKSLLELERLLEELIRAKSKTKKNGKIEKADILEIAVNKMKELTLSPRETSRAFRQGYDCCFAEVKLFFENNHSNIRGNVVRQLETRRREQLNSLGFCSVIRHTKELNSDTEVSSTSVISVEECDSSMWRPWG